jgi:hypothetical protein
MRGSGLSNWGRSRMAEVAHDVKSGGALGMTKCLANPGFIRNSPSITSSTPRPNSLGGVQTSVSASAAKMPTFAVTSTLCDLKSGTCQANAISQPGQEVSATSESIEEDVLKKVSAGSIVALAEPFFNLCSGRASSFTHSKGSPSRPLPTTIAISSSIKRSRCGQVA